MATVNGFLWPVTTDYDEYYYYTGSEDYPELPEGHFAEPLGGGLIDVAALQNATLKDGVVRTYASDIFRQVQAMKALLKPQQ